MSVRESGPTQSDAAESNFYHFIGCSDDCGGQSELTAEALIATVSFVLL